METAYLLITGKLPNREELTRTSVMLNDFSLLHEDMKFFYQNYPSKAHPMGILSAMVNAMRSFYPELMDLEEDISNTFLRLISKVRTMAAMAYKSPGAQDRLSQARLFLRGKFSPHDV